MVKVDPTRRLNAQLEYLRSDERLRERAALAAQLTTAERLAETYALCRWAAFLLAQLPEDERRRALDFHEPVPADSAPALRRLARLSGPAPGTT
ncbi:MAG: hypothetical protein HY906_10350 [Deltaproteobacteria bacterium]|nr:hypothetical protein [Deltaproteobacteria bacterium]